MGVPKLFGWLIKNYPDLVINVDSVGVVESLCLDWNCGIHPCCQRILELNKNNVEITETQLVEQMYEEICKYMDYIVETARPTKTLFIAIDGVAPVAKISQQRKRRFKSAKEKQYKKMLYEKYHPNKKLLEWDSNQITPGTSFLFNLEKKIRTHIKKTEIYNNIECILSGSDEVNEGEHKILAYLRTTDFKQVGIYGLDADLIFLSMTLKNKAVYLLREASFYRKGSNRISKFYEKLHYLDISDLCQRLAYKMSNNYIYGRNWDIDTWRRDFIILGFFLGNDFIPNCNVLDIKYGSIEKLINNYQFVVGKYNKSISIPGTNKIRTNILYKILINLGKGEDKILNAISKNKEKNKRQLPSYLNDYELELWKYENLHDTNKNTSFNKISYGSTGWRKCYYTTFFDKNYDINKIVTEYLKGVVWCYNYYESGVPDWRWFYPYSHPPSLRDITDKLSNINLNDFKFYRNIPVKRLIQLSAVLPSYSSKFLPVKCIKKIHDEKSPLKKLYPENFEEDETWCEKRWETKPILPKINIDLIENIIINTDINY